MGCRLSKDETIDIQNTEMFRDNESKIDYKSRLERKICLAKETPEPIYDLSDCNIKEVPSGVFVLCRVLRKEILNLSKNKLTTFEGGDYSDLALLQILNLSFNKIRKLPHEINRLENLRELNLSNNQIIKLPRTINGLNYLELLDISYNDIRSIEEINCMPNLKILNLQGNRHLRKIPNTLSTCDNLYDLILDPETIEWPPPDVIANGSANILKYLSTGEKDLNINVGSVERVEEALKSRVLMEIQEDHSNNQKIKKPVAVAPYEYGNENALLRELHIRQQKQKQEILLEVLQKQTETESLVSKLQQQKDGERYRLINDIIEAEQKASAIIENLIAMKINPDPALLEKERLEEERLLEQVHLKHSELRKNEIISIMIDVLHDEESRIQDYQEKRDETSRNVLERENETLAQLENFYNDYEQNRNIIIEKICENEELQKQAVAALISKNDARTWGLVEQLKIIEAQLSHMTQLEIARKKDSTEGQMNVLADKRIQLTSILLELLQQKENRRNELLNTLTTMEAQKHNQEDFWLLQYQKLLDSRPLEFSLKTNTIDPLLGYNFLVNGVIHCLPFLQKLWKNENFCLEKVTNDDLKAAGIRDKKDRNQILKSIQEFINDTDNEDIQQPSAPPQTATPEQESPQMSSNTASASDSRSNGPGENQTNQSECVICMEEPVKIIFLPCGHMCCCLNCQQKVDICPLCREIIERKIKVIQP